MNESVSTTEFGIGGAWLAEYTLQSLDAGVLYFDRRAQIVQWNVAAARLLGVGEEQLPGRRIDNGPWLAMTTDGERLSENDDPVRLALEQGEPVGSFTLAIRLPEGGQSWLSITALPIYGPDRRVRGVLASIVSVAGGRRVTEVLAAAVQAGRAAFEHSMSAHVIVDEAGRIVDWNRALCDLVQRPDVELVGRPFEQICSADLERVWVDGAIDRDGDAWTETFAFDSFGTEIEVVGHFTVVDWPGVGRAIMVQLLDAYRFVRSGPTTFQLEMAAYAHVRVAMLTMSLAGNVIELNHAASELFGYPFEAMVGQQVGDHVSFFPTPLPLQSLSESLTSIVPISFGLCSVRQRDGSVVLKDWYMSRVADGRPLVLVQLAEVPLKSLERIADGEARSVTFQLRPPDATPGEAPAT